MMKTETTTEPETATDSPEVAGCAAMTCSLLDGLSERAKQWLDKACEQAADSQGITLDLEARNECELAGLIEVDRRQWVTIHANVMDAVYSNGYLKENDQSLPPADELPNTVES
jgi:hypothetical protein